MNRPSLLVIVRHGESLRNAVKKGNVYLPTDDTAAIIRGIPDHKIPLTENGVRQAEATSAHLRARFGVFDVVYDSGYLRTKQTRAGLLKAYTEEEAAKMKLRTSHLVRERDTGYTYDMTTAEVDKNFPWFRDYWESFGYFYARPIGGKSQADMCEQVYQFNGILFTVRAGQKVLVVTHGGTIRAFRFNLEKWTAEEYENRFRTEPSPENCGVTTYRFKPATNRLELEDYNQVYWK